MAETLEVVEEVKKIITTKTEETNKVFEAKMSEAQKIAAEANAKIDAEVKQLNEDMTKQGKTLGEIAEAVKELKAARGRFKSAEDEVKSTQTIISDLFAEHFEEIKAIRKGQGLTFEAKAAGTMTAANNLTGNVVASYMLTPAVRGRRKINFRDLVPVISSSTGVWKFYQQNSPVGEGSFGFQTTHGAAKNQLDYDLTEKTVTVDYLAGYVRIAKQMLQDLPFMQTFVANELVEDYKRAESGNFFGQLATGATGNATTSATVYAEKLVDWIANLEEVDYDANAIVTTPANWATLLKTKPNDYSVPGGVVIDSTGTVLFCGLPVYKVPSTTIGVGKTFVGDWSKAAIVQAEGLSVNTYEQDQDNVIKNLVTVKAEARVAMALLRPDAFIYA